MRHFNLTVVGCLLLTLASASLVCGAMANSLYDEASFKDLTADKRAKVVGDTLTIVVLESAQATTGAGSADDSEFAFTGSAGANNRAWQYGLGVGSSTDGNATTKRVGSIKAQLSVQVVALDDNKNLVVKGKQLLTINGEAQTIEISGKARRTDIYSNNTLLSSRLFDADIKFTGQGEVTDGKESGIFARLFKWLGFK